jgi:hypothetical protein
MIRLANMPTAWDIVCSEGVTRRAFAHYLQDIYTRDTGGTPEDPLVCKLQLSRYQRVRDSTCQFLLVLLTHWHPIAECATALPVLVDALRPVVRRCVVTVAVLRRFGCTPPLLQRLAKRPAPANLTELGKYVADDSVELWQMKVQVCTDGYFPAVAGHNQGGSAWRRADRGAKQALAARQVLWQQYFELATGTGRWLVGDRVVGPSALVESWPGGRGKVDVLVDSLVQGASMAEQSWVLEAVRGYKDFSAKALLQDVHIHFKAQLPPIEDKASWHGSGCGSTKLMMRLEDVPTKFTAPERLESMCEYLASPESPYKGPVLEARDVSFGGCDFRKYLNHHEGVHARLRDHVLRWKADGRAAALGNASRPRCVLQAALERRKLDATGTKQELAERLYKALVTEPFPCPTDCATSATSTPIGIAIVNSGAAAEVSPEADVSSTVVRAEKLAPTISAKGPSVTISRESSVVRKRPAAAMDVSMRISAKGPAVAISRESSVVRERPAAAMDVSMRSSGKPHGAQKKRAAAIDDCPAPGDKGIKCGDRVFKTIWWFLHDNGVTNTQTNTYKRFRRNRWPPEVTLVGLKLRSKNNKKLASVPQVVLRGERDVATDVSFKRGELASASEKGRGIVFVEATALEAFRQKLLKAMPEHLQRKGAAAQRKSAKRKARLARWR